MTLKHLLQLSLVMTFVVIMLGAYTRLADAGLGCPDWPGCYGQLSVPSSELDLAKASALYPQLTVEADKAWLEMAHRYFAGSLGLLVFAITALALLQKSLGKVLPLSISFVIVFQALLGMWTVTMKLMPVVVMGHLLGGFALFCLLALLYWRVSERQSPVQVFNVSLSVRIFAMIAFVVVVFQIALGGWTSSNYAALMCTELPICQGQWQQHVDIKTAFTLIQPERESYEFGTLEYGARMTIHVAHRIGALFTAIIFIALIVQLFRQNLHQFKLPSITLSALLVIQIGLGISNVVFGLPLIIAVAHNLTAALLLLNTLYINYFVWRTSPNVTPISIQDMGKEAFHE